MCLDKMKASSYCSLDVNLSNNQMILYTVLSQLNHTYKQIKLPIYTDI